MYRKLLRYSIFAVAAVAVIAVACGDDDDDDDGDGGSGGGNTLATVQDRDSLRCGVKDSQPGFGNLEPDGNYSGNDVEFCKAVAAAVLGDPTKVEFILASAGDRFELLANGEIDVLIRTTTWTASRDASLDGSFAITTFYDGQGFMVPAESAVSSIDDLEGASVCVTGGTTTETNLADVFGARGITHTPLSFESDPEVLAAFADGRCDAWTADRSNLAGQRANYPDNAGGPDAVRILPDTVSKEPLGPVTRDNDSEWFDIVNWTVIGMILADELGVTSANVDEMAESPPNVSVARLLGVGFAGGDVEDVGLGLDPDFMQTVIREVGNYDEVYERTIAPLGLARDGSLNASWLDGGLLFAPPWR